MAKIRFYKKDSTSQYSLRVKENKHIEKTRKHKKLTTLFAIISVIEFVLLIIKSL